MLGIAILSGGDAVIVAVSGVFLNWGFVDAAEADKERQR
jgi:hypothetical protein